MVKRALKMDWKRMWETAGMLEKKSGKSRAWLLADMAKCAAKYNAGYVDYKIAQMYRLNDAQRRTVITRGISNSIVRRMNDKAYWFNFDDKTTFNTLFADESIVYSDTYKDTLAEFYKNYYYRYNMIYVEDTAGFEKIAALESRLYPNGSVGVSAVTGVSEETFTQLEAEYTTGTKVTSGDYPNGIYLYAGASYSGKFSAELISAFSDADEVGKVVKVRNADDNASYYVMRYALDDAPYLSEDSKVAACFADLPSYAGQYIYRKLLRDELPKVVSHGVAETYTVVSTASCKDYNIVNLIGN